MKNSILLIAGAVLTVLFLIFPSQIFELGYYDSDFSNQMYNESIYLIVAIITAVAAWGGAALFYYIINSVSFSRWYHWLISLGVVSLLVAIVNYFYADGILSEEGDYGVQLFSFSIIDVVYTAILFIIASFSIRWWSSNCRHTPIPE